MFDIDPFAIVMCVFQLNVFYVCCLSYNTTFTYMNTSKERQTKEYEESHPKTRRSTIVKIEGSIPEDHDPKELSNVSKAKLKREIEQCLVYKTVVIDGGDNTGGSKSSILGSLAKSDRVYSSFVAALSRSKQSASFQDVDVENGIEKNENEETTRDPKESLQRRKSNRLALDCQYLCPRRMTLPIPASCVWENISMVVTCAARRILLVIMDFTKSASWNGL